MKHRKSDECFFVNLEEKLSRYNHQDVKGRNNRLSLSLSCVESKKRKLSKKIECNIKQTLNKIYLHDKFKVISACLKVLLENI